MVKVLRLTRHPAGKDQIQELHRIYGLGLNLMEHPETVPDAARVKEIVSELGAEVLEAVLPLPILAQVIDPRNGVGIPVIRAVMVRTLQEDGSAVFNFSHYERVLKVEVTTERL